MQAKAEEKGLKFTTEQAGHLPRHIVADPGKLRQVLLNLTDNAIKYTQQGGVTLRTDAVDPLNTNRKRLRFEVEDTGCGIDAEDRDGIFTPFMQLADPSASNAGSGLGLAICKQYAERMGGHIGVQSEPGKGSLFYFEIPVIVSSSESVGVESCHDRIIGVAPDQPRYRLLIAEDQPINRMLLSKILEPLDFEMREADNGQAVLMHFEQWQPHLIWMDIRMPVMDGLEATRRIKATEAGRRTKIIAVTAHALEEERAEILAAGCDDFIRKPYQVTEIFECLAKHLGVRYITTGETGAATD
jgi:CheY-like chemotaxis protein